MANTKTLAAEGVDESKILFSKIDYMNEAELDGLPHGAIQLDEDGTILKYNSYESNMANVSKNAAIGRNFFKDVAPCTDVKEFFGRFQEGVKSKNLYAKFRYHFSFKKNPLDVVVTLFYSDITHTVWVFVRPLGHS